MSTEKGDLQITNTSLPLNLAARREVRKPYGHGGGGGESHMLAVGGRQVSTLPLLYHGITPNRAAFSSPPEGAAVDKQHTEPSSSAIDGFGGKYLSSH